MPHAHTTIKVTTAVRDRLKAQAAADGQTLGEHLAYLADLGDRQLRFAMLKDAIDATPPEQLRSYREESAAWEAITNV
jgi:hypothetical protein